MTRRIREEGAKVTLTICGVASSGSHVSGIFLASDGPAFQVKYTPAGARRLRSAVEDWYQLRSRLVHDAEDAVQDTWLRLKSADASEAANLGGGQIQSSQLDVFAYACHMLPEDPDAAFQAWLRAAEYSAPDLWRSAGAYDPLRAGRWPGVSAGVASFKYPGRRDSAITLTPEPEADEVFLAYSIRAMPPMWLEPPARKSLLRFVNGIIAALRLMLIRVLAALSRLVDATNFVLVMIAACLRYGHRQDPDDHHSLPARRYQSWLGRAPAV